MSAAGHPSDGWPASAMRPLSSLPVPGGCPKADLANARGQCDHCPLAVWIGQTLFGELSSQGTPPAKPANKCCRWGTPLLGTLRALTTGPA